MMRLIGIDKAIFSQIHGVEKSLYRLAAIAFIVVVALSFVTNGYMGWMLTQSWTGVVSMSLLMGFIHFSILRIALITMISLPVVPQSSDSTPNSMLQRMKNIANWFSFAGSLRFLFIGLIAVSIAFPGTALLQHQNAENWNNQRRQEVIQESLKKVQGDGQLSPLLLMELRHANYPFYVFHQITQHNQNWTLLFFIVSMVFFPFLILAFLKRGSQFQYPVLASKLVIQEIQMDYSRTIEECQAWMDKQFSGFARSLSDLSPYADPPFNSQLKDRKVRVYGSHEEFQKWLKG